MTTSSPAFNVAARALWIECLAPLETITMSGVQSKLWNRLYQRQMAVFSSGMPATGV
jgi:hypothetical protein